ncbi:MAG: transglutaminase family protein [Anaerolineales bacterium]|nr:transglutaminase family protein [Anaerolineales bacterium]
MTTLEVLSDSNHPAVQARAFALIADADSLNEKNQRLFHFVRDEIRFGFPPVWDAVKASETLTLGMGYCTTKATLLLALCRAVDIPARIHTGLIDINIMRGIFPAFAFPFLPESGSHTWMELQFDGCWKPLDSYINDQSMYTGALKKLHASGKQTGFSISEACGPSSCAYNFGEQGFMHMGAVLEDHGTWDDYAEYMASEFYEPMDRMTEISYPIIARLANRRISKLRAAG